VFSLYRRILPYGIGLLAALLAIADAAGVATASQPHWVCSWFASQQLVEPQNSLSSEDLHDTTLRQIVHLSLGGRELRVRLSNRFSATPLRLTAVHIARSLSRASDKIDVATDQALTFSGSRALTVPAHADYVSDPIAFAVEPLADIAITLHIDVAPSEQTGHPGSRATSYLVPGDSVSAPQLSGAQKLDHWYFIAEIAVTAPIDAVAMVALGDSITDGHGATTNGNDRWTDVLSRRLQSQPSTHNIAVVNAGLGGNRLLADGLGPNALSRFDYDVSLPLGVRYVIVLEGINDIGMLVRAGEVPRSEHDSLVQRMIAAYQQMMVRAHAHDIEVIGATITPFMGFGFYHPDGASEADRQAVNAWIRASGHFDAIVDFDKVTRDPRHPDHLLPAFDSGDHLHPSPAGYKAMAEAVPLSVFAPVTEPAPEIALTFDDLPAHGPLPVGETRIEVISKIISALRDANLPATYGFVNGLDLDQHPGDLAVLQQWHLAGNLLGNHSWSHMNLNVNSLEAFEQDVARDEPLLAGIMQQREDWHWFRYPFLAEGETPAKKTGFRNFLRDRGYQVAAVTMSFGDYMWNEPFARCKTKGDAAGIAALENSYMASADESITYYRGLSHTLYHRDIPYVLLMHVGAFDAEMLPRLLELYRVRGFEFIALAKAESDEFYRIDTNLSLPAGPEMLESMMSERHLRLPSRTDFAGKIDAVCR
jgi:lysophospholipase L1-like esterase